MPSGRIEKLEAPLSEWEGLLRDIVGKITQGGEAENVYVFGSFTRQEMTTDSDLDIAVVIPDVIPPQKFRERLPSPLSSWPLDLIIVNRSRFEVRKRIGGVLMDVAMEGIELYPEWKLRAHDSKR